MFSMAAMLKIMLIGSKGVGKTELTPWTRFATEYKHTVGTDIAIYSTVLPNISKKVKLQLWEINFADRFELIRDTLWLGTSGAILVWDVTDRDSFLQVNEWWIKLSSSVGQVPVLRVANKIDEHASREVTTEEGLAYCSENGFDYVESGKENRANFEQALPDFALKVYQWVEENK